MVDDSWFSPNYNQLSPTIIQMVERPKKFVKVDDSSLAVVQAKSPARAASSKFFPRKIVNT